MPTPAVPRVARAAAAAEWRACVEARLRAAAVPARRVVRVVCRPPVSLQQERRQQHQQEQEEESPCSSCPGPAPLTAPAPAHAGAGAGATPTPTPTPTPPPPLPLPRPGQMPVSVLCVGRAAAAAGWRECAEARLRAAAVPARRVVRRPAVSLQQEERQRQRQQHHHQQEQEQESPCSSSCPGPAPLAAPAHASATRRAPPPPLSVQVAATDADAVSVVPAAAATLPASRRDLVSELLTCDLDAWVRRDEERVERNRARRELRELREDGASAGDEDLASEPEEALPGQFPAEGEDEDEEEELLCVERACAGAPCVALTVTRVWGAVGPGKRVPGCDAGVCLLLHPGECPHRAGAGGVLAGTETATETEAANDDDDGCCTLPPRNPAVFAETWDGRGRPQHHRGFRQPRRSRACDGSRRC